jgi:hypothetical protein
LAQAEEIRLIDGRRELHDAISRKHFGFNKISRYRHKSPVSVMQNARWRAFYGNPMLNAGHIRFFFWH